MAGWLEGIEEAAFRPASSGHIYMSPNPWLFGRSRYYLVTDAQKAMIGPLLRKRGKVALVVTVLTMLIAVPLFFVLHGSLPRISPILFGLSFGVLIMLPMLIIPHVYLMRQLGPIIPQLTPTEERFTTRQQLSRLATAMPKWSIYTGFVGGILMLLSALFGIVDIIVEGHGRWWSPIVGMTSGVLFLVYSMYLVHLRKQAEAR
jgi:hypothetical protein